MNSEQYNTFRAICKNMAECLQALKYGDDERGRMLVAQITEQMIQLSLKLGFNVRYDGKIQGKPWERLNISRATYYRDQRRNRDRNRERGGAA